MVNKKRANRSRLIGQNRKFTQFLLSLIPKRAWIQRIHRKIHSRTLIKWPPLLGRLAQVDLMSKRNKLLDFKRVSIRWSVIKVPVKAFLLLFVRTRSAHHAIGLALM